MTENTPSLGWGHINVNVSNLEASIAFYEKLGFQTFIPAIPYLGLQKGSAGTPLPQDSATALGIAHGTKGRACIMQLDEGFPKLDLTEFDGEEQRAPLTNADIGLVRICLASRNLAEDYERLTAKGVEFLSPPQKGDQDLADMAICRDPDGTLIELLQIYPEKWAVLDVE